MLNLAACKMYGGEINDPSCSLKTRVPDNFPLVPGAQTTHDDLNTNLKLISLMFHKVLIVRINAVTD